MSLYGLIGNPVAHSFSARYFNRCFERWGMDASYRLFPLKDIARLPELLLQHPSLLGLNVTLPHKQSVIPLLSELSDRARDIGAVNCIRIEKDKLIGENTDALGFEISLRRWLQGVRPRSSLILGTGGSAQAVRFVLNTMGLDPLLVSRSPSAADQLSYADLRMRGLEEFELIVNCTPLGMGPDSASLPDIPLDGLNDRHWLYDLVYTPAPTRLMQEARTRGAHRMGGIRMLLLQAQAGWQFWHPKTPNGI